MVALQYQPTDWISPQEYLARERMAPFKSEYVNGQIYAMAGASLAHVTITTSVVSTLYNRLRGKGCRPFTQDLRVRVPQTTLYIYPDVLVACLPFEFDDDQKDTLVNPVVIIEVLSPSTAEYDRGDKWAHYQRLTSLRDYILVAQDRPRLEHYSRQPNGDWVLHTVEEMMGEIILQSIGCTLGLADVYENVEFESLPARAPLPNPPT